MLLWESTRIALRALRANKMRTILTMLGIIIGVAAVIALIAIGNGFRDRINEQFAGMGTNLLGLQAGKFNIFEQSGPTSRNANQKPPPPLTMADAEALANPVNVSGVVAVAPEYSVGMAAVVRGQQQMQPSITGVTPAYESVRNYRTVLGQFITQEHVDRRARVVVLGHVLARELFEPYEYPIGELVRIQGIPFEVIGILEEKGSGGFSNPYQDNTALIPISAAQTRLGKADAYRGSLVVSQIGIQAVSQDQMETISTQITALMRDRHRLEEGQEDDFTIISQNELMDFGNSFARGMTLFLGSIAGVSLVVGGIGIMNIMLVSVTERTREIGIRKAVGARRRDILIQFLVEAVVLSLLGGFLGIALGYGVSSWVARLLPQAFNEAVVTLDSVLLATGFSIAIGLFFGVYPATRAARLRPIEALRYE